MRHKKKNVEPKSKIEKGSNFPFDRGYDLRVLFFFCWETFFILQFSYYIDKVGTFAFLGGFNQENAVLNPIK